MADLRGHNVTAVSKVLDKCSEQDAAIVLTVCQRAKDGAIFILYPDGVTVPTDKLIEMLEASIKQIKKGQGIRIEIAG